MSATAHAPGSVTLLFAPAGDGDRSLGASVAVADGVTATVDPDAPAGVRVDGLPTSFAPVEHALDDLGVSAGVDLVPAVPVGCGFGASGAATLATVLAADAAFDLDRERDALVDAAHRAEVAAGTGLGDVYVQARGGLVYDVGDGGGRRSLDVPLEYEAIAGIPTADVLADADAVERVRTAADDCVDRFDPEGPLESLLDLGWEFARAAGLASDRVADAVERVRSAGGAASMAMLGETVVGVGGGGVLPGRTRITAEGARLLDAGD